MRHTFKVFCLQPLLYFTKIISSNRELLQRSDQVFAECQLHEELLKGHL